MNKICQLLLCFALAVIANACMKIGDDTRYEPDETLYRTGDISLHLSVENMATRVSMDDLGHFLFEEGDSVAAVCTDGTIFKMFLDGTGGTKRATFNGSVPAGKTLGDIVVYPYSSIKSYSHGVAIFDLPSVQEYDADYNCPMVGRIAGEDYNVQMNQSAACLRLSVKDFPEDAKKVVFKDAGGNALSGLFECDLTSGITAKKAEGDLTMTLAGSYSKPQFSICIPPGDYSALTVTFFDKEGKEMSSQRISDGQLTFEKATLTRLEIQSAIVVKSYKVIINDTQSEKFEEISPDHYEVIFNAPATGEMVLLADGQEYGFTPYSGAGGLGQCKNLFSALPYYNYTDNHTNLYEVGKAIGAMYPLLDGGAKFWLNMPEPATVKAVMDLSYGSYGSYYFEVVKEDSDDVILDEDFDLFTCGGDQTWFLKGTLYGPSADEYDGLMAGTKGKAAWTATGSKNVMWDYPDQVANIVANETYIKNRGVDNGWIFQSVDERPGGIQVGQATSLPKLTTPPFEKLSGPSNVHLTIELNRYGSGSSHDINIVLKNGGKFKSGHVHQTEAKDIDGVHFNAIDADITGLDSDTYVITQDYCMLHYSAFNTSPFKAVSVFDLNIEGATPDTRIEIYPSDEKSRFIVYSIKVERN